MGAKAAQGNAHGGASRHQVHELARSASKVSGVYLYIVGLAGCEQTSFFARDDDLRVHLARSAAHLSGVYSYLLGLADGAQTSASTESTT